MTANPMVEFNRTALKMIEAHEKSRNLAKQLPGGLTRWECEQFSTVRITRNVAIREGNRINGHRVVVVFLTYANGTHYWDVAKVAGNGWFLFEYPPDGTWERMWESASLYCLPLARTWAGGQVLVHSHSMQWNDPDTWRGGIEPWRMGSMGWLRLRATKEEEPWLGQDWVIAPTRLTDQHQYKFATDATETIIQRALQRRRKSEPATRPPLDEAFVEALRAGALHEPHNEPSPPTDPEIVRALVEALNTREVMQ